MIWIVFFILVTYSISLSNRIDNLSKKIDKFSILLKGYNVDSDITYKEIDKFIIDKAKQNTDENNVYSKTTNKVNNSFTLAKQTSILDIDFEKKWGLRLSAWLGGISFIFAAFFMIKYAIENSTLSPSVRLFLSGIFGSGLVYGGFYFNKKSVQPSKISISLIGTGIVILYLCSFAASNYYNIIYPLVSFFFMSIITLMAMTLAIYCSYEIAVFALVGGFITPFLFNSALISHAYLFLYIFVFYTLFISLIYERRWLLLIPIILIIPYSWVMIWFIFYFQDSYIFIIIPFLILTSAIYLYNENKYSNKTPYTYHIIVIIFTALFSGISIKLANFSIFEISMFWVLSAGSLFLAFFKNKSYYFVPWITLFINVISILSYNKDFFTYQLIILSYWLLFAGVSYFNISKNYNNIYWSALLLCSTLIYYVVGYSNSYISYYNDFTEYRKLWNGLGFFISYSFFHLIKLKINQNIEEKDKLLSIFSIGVLNFIFIELIATTKIESISSIIAGEILILGWILYKFRAFFLYKIIEITAYIYLFSIAIELIDLSTIIPLMASRNLVNYINITHVIIGAISISINVYFLKQIINQSERLPIEHISKINKIYNNFQIYTVLLITLIIEYYAKLLFNLYKIEQDFIIEILVTDIVLLANIFYFYLASRFNLDGVKKAAQILNKLLIFRIIYFHIIRLLMILNEVNIGISLIFNLLIPAYAIPILFFYFVNQYSGKDKLGKANKILIFLLIFIYLYLNIRQYFNRGYLTGPIYDAELYSYSMMGLIIGISFLYIGITKNDKIMRIASLITMIITVLKVFLIDASKLIDLYRVFSFLGLGICLFILSFCYSKYVFKKDFNKK